MSTLRNRTKADPQRSGMTHAKWRAVQALQPTKRMLHESAKYVTWANGHSLQTPIKVVTGGTYNVGRNAAKRARRLAARAA
jgi:hypothetical protein